MKKTYAVVVLDGFGISSKLEGNAVKLAKIPNFDSLQKKYPYTTLKASGESVGLFKGQMGNSEVGHLNLGAGRVVNQDVKIISKQIKDGSFYKNNILKKAFNTKGDVHLMGLISDAGVHAHIDHLLALIDMAKKQKSKNVYLHLFTDGRDSAVTNSIKYIKKIQSHLKKTGVGKIASICGRYYAMDRDNNWDRTEKVYNMLVYGKSQHKALSAIKAIKKSHENGITDEFIETTVILENDKPTALIKNNDSVIFFNFRADRARQLTKALTSHNFNNFDAQIMPKLNFVEFTEYDETLKHLKTAFKSKVIKNTLGQVLAKKNKTQLRIAESVKYAHVTYFFNGGIEKPNKNEDRVLIDTKKVKTFDLLPQMSISQVVNTIKTKVIAGKYDFVLANFANCDMVGHTGNLKAAIKAVEAVDKALGQVVEHFKSINGCVLITADHGNAEDMILKNGGPQTAHTLNSVPFILVDDKYKNAKLKHGGKLSDVSATLLDLMEIKKPKEFSANSLLEKQ